MALGRAPLEKDKGGVTTKILPGRQLRGENKPQTNRKVLVTPPGLSIKNHYCITIVYSTYSTLFNNMKPASSKKGCMECKLATTNFANI